MRLAVDRRDEKTLGTHALVVGISSYDHLVGGARTYGNTSLGMLQLSSAARSAFRFYEWLTNTAHLSKPLSTCRLLLAPSVGEAAEPGIEEHAQPCSVNDFLLAANEWIEDACRSKDEATIFYFAGHKLQIGAEEDILLFQDFGSKIGPMLRGGVSFSNIFNGMASRDVLCEQTQHYFIDGSRERTTTADLGTLARGATDVFDVKVRQQDRRAAGVYHAAAPGTHAWARADGVTFFTEALLQGLTGSAGTKTPGGGGWVVTTASLAQWMGQASERYTRGDAVQVRFPVSIRGEGVICELAGPPEVGVTVSVHPPEAGSEARLRVSTADGAAVVEMAMNPLAVRLQLRAGIYQFELNFPSSSRWKNVRILEFVLPPMFELMLEVAE